MGLDLFEWRFHNDIRLDIPQSVGLLSTRDRPVAGIWQRTQHSQETDIHAHDGIRTRNPSKRSAQTVALYRTATGIGMYYHNILLLLSVARFGPFWAIIRDKTDTRDV
jgi:hypothetical protein